MLVIGFFRKTNISGFLQVRGGFFSILIERVGTEI